MRSEVIARLAERLPSNNFDALIDSLNRSPELQGDLQWLNDVLDAADELPLPEVPTSVSARLHGLWPTAASQRRESATLIHDSRSAGELVGVRGIQRTAGWTALFTAASADFAIDGSPSENVGFTRVAGQVLSRSTDRPEYTVRASGPTVTIAITDDVGQFVLGELPHGTYELEAEAQDHLITATISVGP